MSTQHIVLENFWGTELDAAQILHSERLGGANLVPDYAAFAVGHSNCVTYHFVRWDLSSGNNKRDITDFF